MNPAERLLGRTKQLLERTMRGLSKPVTGDSSQPSQDQSSSIVIGDSRNYIFSPSYRKEDILDVNKENIEIETWAKEMKRAQDQLLHEPKVQMASKDRELFIASERKYVAIRAYSASLDEDYQKFIDSGQLFFLSNLVHYEILSTSCAVIMRDNIARIMQLADKYSLSPALRNYYSLQEAGFIGELGVRIGGLSLSDFLSRDAGSKFIPAQIFQFLVAAYEVRSKKTHDQVLQSNRDNNPLTRYPNIFKWRVEVASAMIFALVNSTPDTFKEIVEPDNNKEVETKAKTLVEHTYKLRQDMYRTIADPNSPQFPQLKEAIEYCFNQDSETNIALNIVGLREIPNIYEFYRKACSYVQQGIFPEFYSQVSKAIKAYAEEAPLLEGVLTEDNLVSIIDPDKKPATNNNVPTLENFSQIIGQIFSRVPIKNYAPSIETINWHQLVPPQRVNLSFHPNTPKRFSIQFDYLNEYGDSLFLKFWGDLKKSILDWSFIEQFTESEEFLNLYRSLLFITQAILQEAQEHTQSIYEQRQRDKLNVSTIPVQTYPKKENERPDTTVPKRRNVVREIKAEQNARELLTKSEKEETNQVISSNINKQLIIPSLEEQSRIARRLSHEDQERVFKIIKKYNITQLGKFLPLELKGPNGEILWSMDISSIVPGRIRALATPSEYGNREIKFVILDIDYRKDIYKRWHV